MKSVSLTSITFFLVAQLASSICSTNIAAGQATHSLPKDGNKSKKTFTETDIRLIEGWTVHVDVSLLNEPHQALGKQAIKMLANHLQRIKILLPKKALARIQSVEIRLDRNHPRIKTACYHPSERWLIENGHDRTLAKKIHLPNAQTLLSREQMLKHPAFILHEFAHAYHDQVLSFGNREIRTAYRAAKKSKKYEAVLAHTGKTVRHYGLNNPQEYFAEATEAYFYRNDFYPFLRAELKEFDPDMESLLTRVWNVQE